MRYGTESECEEQNPVTRGRTPYAVDLGTAQRTLFLAAAWTAESIMKIDECTVSGRETDEKLGVGGGGVSCRASVTRILFDCEAEFETRLHGPIGSRVSGSIFPSLSVEAPNAKYAFKIE